MLSDKFWCVNCYEQTVVSAMGQKFHPECFTCFQCQKPIRSGLFHLENGQPYCDAGMLKMQVVIASQLDVLLMLLRLIFKRAYHFGFSFQYTGL